MLFLLDASGVPSVAQFIQLTNYTTTPPTGQITAPASDVTISAGSSVSFSTTSPAAKYAWVFPGGTPTTSTAQNPGAVKFTKAGEYVISMTAIDATGNSDPSPPTRKVTVLPAVADFELDIDPPSGTVNPGGSTSYTVTLTPLAGFSGTVTLSVASEHPFPAGIKSLGFVPPTITGSGTSVLTMKTGLTTTPYGLSLTVTGTSGSLTHTAPTSLVISMAPPSGLSATPTGTSQVTLSWGASTEATSYSVRRSTTSGGPYVTVGCVTGTSFVDNGLTPGTTYYYVVSAAFTGGPNGGGESANTAEVSATP